MIVAIIYSLMIAACIIMIPCVIYNVYCDWKYHHLLAQMVTKKLNTTQPKPQNENEKYYGVLE